MSLICPKCKHDLYEINVEGVALDFCSNCKGIWFDKEEISYYLALTQDLPHLTVGDFDAKSTPYFCPRCSRQMTEIELFPEEKLVIERCPKCHGLWFDSGEVAAAKEIAGKFNTKDSEINRVMSHIDSEALLKQTSRPFRSRYVIGVFAFFVALAVNASFMKTCRKKNPVQAFVAETGVEARRVVFKCPTCRGSGKVSDPCKACFATGRLPQVGTAGKYRRISCLNCSGSGKASLTEPEKCGKCAGEGWIYDEKQPCRTCNGKGQLGIGGEVSDCTECYGTGVTLQDVTVCKECFGTGEADPIEKNSCPKCFGTGMVAVADSGGMVCPTCSGKGILNELDCSRCNGKGSI